MILVVLLLHILIHLLVALYRMDLSYLDYTDLGNMKDIIMNITNMPMQDQKEIQ